MKKKLTAGLVAVIIAGFVYGSVRRYAPLTDVTYNGEDEPELTDEEIDRLTAELVPWHVHDPLPDFEQDPPTHDFIAWLHGTGSLNAYYAIEGRLDQVIHLLMDMLLEHTWMRHIVKLKDQPPG